MIPKVLKKPAPLAVFIAAEALLQCLGPFLNPGSSLVKEAEALVHLNI
jgi:hypothetical protein